MVQGPTIYDWECPICGTTRTGLTHGRGAPVEDEARNAIIGHVRQTLGDGHGEEGEVPPGFDEVDIADSVRYREEFGGRTAPGGRG